MLYCSFIYNWNLLGEPCKKISSGLCKVIPTFYTVYPKPATCKLMLQLTL